MSLNGRARGDDYPRRSFSRAQRLRSTADFREAYRQQQRWTGRNMVLWLRSGEDAGLRLGVVASRKVGNAVARARAKRRLREVYRRHSHRLAGQVDVVLVARRAILKSDWRDIEAEWLRLAARSGLLRPVDVSRGRRK